MNKEKEVQTADKYQLIDIDRLNESPMNPRKRFDEKALNELAESLKSRGILTPLLVRTYEDGFEIGAGHRRFRAAKIAGIEKVPCLVRDMDDDQFLELLIIENNQREDVHPLEEAEGYFALSRRPGYDVAKIALNIGRSEKYVYDRMKLLSLTKNAQKLFLDNKFSAGHAIILARLSPVNQELAIKTDNALFQTEYTMFDSNYDGGDSIKARSLREFEEWVDTHVRFDRDNVDEFLFPETAEAIKAAKEKKVKIVPITQDHYIQESARTDERTIVPTSWRRADGQKNSKTCEHSVLGVIVCGEGRSESFLVCINKEKCLVHWADFHKARQERIKQQEATPTPAATTSCSA